MSYEKLLVSAKKGDQESEDINQCGLRKSEIDKIDFDLKVQHKNGGLLRRCFFREKTIN